MSVVIISAATFCHGDEVAARAADLLEYRCVGRDEVIEAAARTYGATPSKLIQAIDERASWRPMPDKERRIHLAALQATLAEHLLQGDCVCHGLAAHLYVAGISHVLKVRLNAPVEVRIATASRQKHLGEAKARKLVLGHDKRRRRWVTHLFSVDEDDPEQFDLVVDHATTGSEDTAALVADMARRRRFEPMTYSRKQGRDYALASLVRAAIVTIDPKVVVHADDGVIHIETMALAKNSRKIAVLKERALAVPHVEQVDVDVIEDVFAGAAVSMR
jgi:cytidylate kinase